MPSDGIPLPNEDTVSLNTILTCSLALVYTIMSHLTVVIKAIKAIIALAFLNIFDSKYTTSDMQLYKKKKIQQNIKCNGNQK